MASGFEISASALSAERLRMDVIANNIANEATTRTSEGGPYKRKLVVFAPRSDDFNDLLASFRGEDPKFSGVKVTGIVNDPSPSRLVYDPSHPDADARGFVAYPNINVVQEMVDLMSASRSYQANITAINEWKTMLGAARAIVS